MCFNVCAPDVITQPTNLVNSITTQSVELTVDVLCDSWMIKCYFLSFFGCEPQEKKAAETAREKELEDAKDEKRRLMDSQRLRLL